MRAGENEPRHTHGVRQHGPAVGSQGQEGQQVEHEPVDDAVHVVPGRDQHDEEDHELRVEDQEPGDDGEGRFDDKGLNRATVKRGRKMCLADTIQKDSWVVILISGKQTSEQERRSETKRVAIIFQEYITILNVFAPNNTT